MFELASIYNRSDSVWLVSHRGDIDIVNKFRFNVQLICTVPDLRLSNYGDPDNEAGCKTTCSIYKRVILGCDALFQSQWDFVKTGMNRKNHDGIILSEKLAQTLKSDNFSIETQTMKVLNQIIEHAEKKQFRDFLFTNSAIPEKEVDSLYAITNFVEKKYYFSSTANASLLQNKLFEAYEELDKRSFATLKPKRYLNDRIIHIWLKW